MDADPVSLAARLESLERTTRRTRLFAAATAIGLVASWLTAGAWPQGPPGQETMRTRLLIIEDAQGRDRIVFGAPMPDGREFTGMKILNPDGEEQWGLSLRPDGRVSMGFDARPGLGDPRNRERLNLGVTATGQGWIRYLDNQTRARLLLQLDSTETPVLEFLHWPDDERIRVRQLGFSGDKSLEWKR